MAATGRVFGEGEAGEPVRQSLHPVAVAHPDLERRGQLVKQGGAAAGQSPASGGAFLVQGGVAELLLGAPGDGAAQLVHQGLHAVADAQHRQLPLKHPVRDERRAVLVHAGRSPGQDDALGVDAFHLFPRIGGVGNLGVDLQLPDPAGDEVAVLGAEVDDGDTLVDLPARARCLGVGPAGNFQVGGDLQVIACGHSPAQRQLRRSRGGPPSAGGVFGLGTIIAGHFCS